MKSLYFTLYYIYILQRIFLFKFLYISTLQKITCEQRKDSIEKLEKKGGKRREKVLKHGKHRNNRHTNQPMKKGR